MTFFENWYTSFHWYSNNTGKVSLTSEVWIQRYEKVLNPLTHSLTHKPTNRLTRSGPPHSPPTKTVRRGQKIIFLIWNVVKIWKIREKLNKNITNTSKCGFFWNMILSPSKNLQFETNSRILAQSVQKLHRLEVKRPHLSLKWKAVSPWVMFYFKMVQKLNHLTKSAEILHEEMAVDML